MRLVCYNNKDNLLAGMICGGWDPYDGGQVFEIPLGGTLMKMPYAVGGSGSTYIFGLVDSLYKPGMTKNECKDFVAKCKLFHIIIRYYDIQIPYLSFISFLVRNVTVLSYAYVGISHAIARDGSSGGVIRLVTVDQSGFERECLLGTL